MSERYLGGFVSLSFNPLGTQTTSYTYGLWSWGINTAGGLGQNNTISKSSPVQVGSLTNWLSISSGRYGTQVATKTDGTLWSWGNGGNGATGQGNTINTSSPVQVGALTNWLSVSAGTYHCLSIKTDGTLWSWGFNNLGQLGQNNTTYKSSPVQVGALTNWLKISCGRYHNSAIKSDGTLWTWGNNDRGQLGLNASYSIIGSKSSPTQVGALTTWASTTCTGYSTYAIKTDGTLWSWGRNSEGQLGIGNTIDRSSPVQIGALTTWSKSSKGFGYLLLAIKTDGTLWSWGANAYGQLGLGNYTNYSSPKQVGALTTWLNVTTGYAQSIAIKTDGTLWSWGWNNNGQLGLGNKTNYSSPKQVGALTTWPTSSTLQSISAGSFDCQALQI